MSCVGVGLIKKTLAWNQILCIPDRVYAGGVVIISKRPGLRRALSYSAICRVKMLKECCAVGCNNLCEKGNGLSFYTFPTDPDRRSKWIAAVNRKEWYPTEHTVICSEHFIHG